MQGTGQYRRIKKMCITNERRFYQNLIGEQCSDNHWREVCRRLKISSLEVSEKNLEFYCKVKGIIPRSAIGIIGILSLYSEAVRNLRNSKAEITGEEIHNLLKKKGINPPQPTLSRWFKPIGGYRKNKNYKSKDVELILVKALVYKVQYQNQTKLREENV